MLHSYFKTAFRSLGRYPLHTALNVLGLSIGIASCILAMMYIRREYAVDGFHEGGDRIYQVVRETRNASSEHVFQPGATGALAPVLEAECPEIERVMRAWVRAAPVAYGQQRIRLGFGIVDKDFFEFFSIPLAAGNASEVLARPNSIVIAQRKAKLLFGEEDPIGKTVRVTGRQVKGLYTVTGISGRPPALSHVEFNCVVSTPPIPETWQTSATVGTYVKLRKGTRPGTLAPKLEKVIQNEVPTEYGKTVHYHLHPFDRFHVDAREKFGFWGFNGPYMDRSRLYTVVFVAILTLVIACANFVNLTTAKAITRAREVGLRKVVGALRRQLITQFLGEAMLVVFVASVAGIGVAEFVRPWFTEIIGGNVRYDPEMQGWVIGAVPVLVLMVGLLAGAYPSFVLSRFDSVRAMKETGTSAGGGAGLRKGLVITQFALSIFLVATTAAVRYQTEFMMNRDLGFESDHLIVLPIFVSDEEARLTFRYDVVKRSFLEHPNVVKASAYRYQTGRWPGRPRVMRPEGGGSSTWQVPLNEVDEDFLDTFGIDLVAGRGFRGGADVDQINAFLVNEAAVTAFGWDNPIGEQIEWVGTGIVGTVVGVMADFNTDTLRKPIGPLIFCKWNRNYYNLGVKVTSTDLSATIAFLEKTWHRYLPGVEFQYNFLEDRVNEMYADEERFSRILSTFACLAIAVACLGLVGLVAFIAQRRAREIAIRKVLGASIGSLLVKLSKEFLLLVIAANVVALPVAYVVIRRWLEDYAYRVELGPEVYAGAGVVALLTAAASVIPSALRSSSASPAQTLRTE